MNVEREVRAFLQLQDNIEQLASRFLPFSSFNQCLQDPKYSIVLEKISKFLLKVTKKKKTCKPYAEFS